MRILVTNDDGIFAPGLEVMIQVLQHFADVTVICPDQKKSPAGYSITCHKPIKAIPLDLFPGTKGTWCIDGSPVDCIKLGIEVLMKETPDFLFSGIYSGPILGRDLYYTGTMAAAAEAILSDVPFASVSLNTLSNQQVNFSKVSPLLYKITEILLKHNLPKSAFLNINLPYISKAHCKGVKVIPPDMTVSRYRYLGLPDPHGPVYYWLKDLLHELEHLECESDFQLLRDGYITVSPVDIGFQDKKNQEQIDDWFNNHLFKGAKQI
jgi:5'-nucleotidase